MIDGAFFITSHAVEQFRRRIAPLPYEEAREAIIAELASHAQPMKPLASGVGYYTRTRGGRFLFRAVIVPGEKGTAPAVATILRSGK